MVQRSESGGHPRIAALQFDYMAPLGRGKLETGVKMTYRQNNIDHKMYEHDATTDTWQLSVPLSNDLRHREYIPAAYAMYSSKLTKLLTMKAGLRLEYSRVTLQNDKDRLDEASNSFFVAPNIVLNYRVSEPWQLSFGLSRRISRPTYPQLNPYINLIDNQTYETGNVHLKPEKANKLDLGYTYTGQTLKVSGNAYLNYPQFTTKTIHYCNLGIRQQLPKTSLTLSALVTDVFNTRRWDISSDNSVYTLTNTSRNRSRVLWLGFAWNFHSYKPLVGKKQQEEDRSVIRLGE